MWISHFIWKVTVLPDCCFLCNQYSYLIITIKLVMRTLLLLTQTYSYSETPLHYTFMIFFLLWGWGTPQEHQSSRITLTLFSHNSIRSLLAILIALSITETEEVSVLKNIRQEVMRSMLMAHTPSLTQFRQSGYPCKKADFGESRGLKAY